MYENNNNYSQSNNAEHTNNSYSQPQNNTEHANGFYSQPQNNTEHTNGFYSQSQNNTENTNNFYSQSQNNATQNSAGNTNNYYQGHYYSTGSASGNFGQTIDASPKKKQKKQKKSDGKATGFGKKTASAACLGLVFGVTAGAVFSVPAYMATRELNQARTVLEQAQSSIPLTSDQNASVNKPSLSTTVDPIPAANTAYSTSNTANVSAIVQNCLPSVVSITNKGITEVRTMFGTYQQDTESSGSGIIIGENETELLIVTNYHVVSGSNELSVVFSYDEDSDSPSLVSARVKGYDADKDLAVISVSLADITDDMRSQIKIATIGNSSNLILGQEVVAIGNALGYGQSVTTGIISALNREVTVSDDNGGTITNKLIQTDAAINPGNSGGALLNMNGELIGINSVKVSSSSVEGMGYAIPISDVQSIIEELMLKETRDVVAESAQGSIGIGGTDVTSDISSTYDMPLGIYINKIYDNSPAKAAGLSKGNIITKFDGQTVKSMNELKSLLTYYKAGETVEIIAMVQGADGYVEQTFYLTLGTKDVFGDDTNKQETPSQDSKNQSGNYYNPFDFWSTFPY